MEEDFDAILVAFAANNPVGGLENDECRARLVALLVAAVPEPE